MRSIVFLSDCDSEGFWYVSGFRGEEKIARVRVIGG